MPATMEVIGPGEIDQWDQALGAFLAENERRPARAAPSRPTAGRFNTSSAASARRPTASRARRSLAGRMHQAVWP